MEQDFVPSNVFIVSPTDTVNLIIPFPFGLFVCVPRVKQKK